VNVFTDFGLVVALIAVLISQIRLTVRLLLDKSHTTAVYLNTFFSADGKVCIVLSVT